MLNKIFLFLVIAGIISVQAKEIRSIQPLFTEQTAALDDRILGAWPGIFGDSLIFSKSGDNFYRLEQKDKTGSKEFEVHLVKKNTDDNGWYFASLYPVFIQKSNNPDPAHVLPMFSFYRIRLSQDTITVQSLRYAWFRERAIKLEYIPAYVSIPGGLLLTAPTADLIRFFTANDSIAAMYTGALKFGRDGTSDKTGSTVKTDTSLAVGKQDKDLIKYLQDCLPAFPGKDGWLGGDGAISVPIDDEHVLWMFGDTFVGQKNQHVREGASMVSNTIAVSTCDPDTGWDIHYYWRGMYGDTPAPFFQTYTDRYRYWPQDAFRYKGAIYIALNKVGPGYGLNDDLGFENIGATLVRITGYEGQPPENWRIGYFPWSEVIEQHNWKGMAVHKGHLYLFTQFPDKKAFLRRVPLDHLDQPAEYMEYWSAARVWKQGMDTVGVQTVFEEHISGSGGSVTWHDDIAQWVLVHGPGWYAREIYMHTAPALTGPWSPGKVIYEVPERIEGNPEYHQDKFCYFAREHASFYDPDMKKLTFTYDCNIDPFTELIKKLDVYFPRVVQYVIEARN
jgi:hypothetical protein